MIKKGISIFAIGLILVACNSVKKLTSIENKQIKQQVNTVLNDWHLAAAEANFDNYFSKMDSVSVFIGTDATENWNKQEFIAYSKPYFDNGKAWSFTTLERNIYIHNSGNLVWFDELLSTQMGTCRGSGILEKKGISWKIKQYVLSIAIPNEAVNAVIEAKKKNDDLFLKKFKK